jgi:hypothetical protein
MKRYRLVNFDFDSRATVLGMNVLETWEPAVQASWRENQSRMRESVINEFGVASCERKIDDFVDLGPAPMSVVAFHNVFYRQARAAFTCGAYYPALVGAVALGERVLNHLIRTLAVDFGHTSEYAKAVKKESFDDWDWMINTLVSWSVLLPDAAEAFRKLKVLRHASVHFRPELDENPRPLAIEAIALLGSIIEGQFSAFGSQPWFIPDTPGVSFVRRGAESEPFVKRVLVPNAVLVGPLHRLQSSPGGWEAVDEQYPDVEVSDEAFAGIVRGELSVPTGQR